MNRSGIVTSSPPYSLLFEDDDSAAAGTTASALFRLATSSGEDNVNSRKLRLCSSHQVSSFIGCMFRVVFDVVVDDQFVLTIRNALPCVCSSSITGREKKKMLLPLLARTNVMDS